MSSKPAEPRSIASQLVLLFTLAAAFLLSCGLGALYWIVVQHAYEEDNEVLADKVAAVRADLTAPNGLNVVTEQLKSVRAGERATYWVRILDSTKRVIAETPGMSALLPITLFAEAKRPTDFPSQGHLFSVMTTEYQTATDRFTIQVAQ